MRVSHVGKGAKVSGATVRGNEIRGGRGCEPTRARSRESRSPHSSVPFSPSRISRRPLHPVLFSRPPYVYITYSYVKIGFNFYFTEIK